MICEVHPLGHVFRRVVLFIRIVLYLLGFRMLSTLSSPGKGHPSLGLLDTILIPIILVKLVIGKNIANLSHPAGKTGKMNPQKGSNGVPVAL